MSTVEIVRFAVREGGAEALGDALMRAREGYLAPPRCEGFEAFGSAETGEAVVVVRWASRAAHDEAAAAPEAAPFLAALGDLATGPPELGWYAELGR